MAIADDLSLTPDLMLEGALELPLTKFLAKYVTAGQTVIDVGANIGYFTVLLGHLVGPKGRVYAYEPNPHTWEVLIDNISINYLQDRTVAVNKAAYSSATRLSFYCAKRFAGNSSIHSHSAQYFSDYQDEVESIEIDAEPLDDLIARHGKVDLVKIDIEGGEYHAFLGMRESLRRGAVRATVFELNKAMLQGDWDGLCGVLEDLQADGMEFYTLSLEGEMRQASLPSLLEAGSNPHVVMTSTR